MVRRSALPPSRFVLIGPPGAGKGTQAGWMRTALGWPVISSSDTIRRVVAAESPRASELGAIMAAGALVPDALMTDLMRARLAEPDAANGFVLDGFPRTVSQAEALDGFVSDPAVLAIVLEVPDAEIERRLTARRVCTRCRMPQSSSSHQSGQRDCAYCRAPLEQREDDNEETVKRRLSTYRAAVAPLLEYYRQRARLIDVDASRPVGQVSREIARRIGAGPTT